MFKILVVDDDENNVNFLIRKLTKSGYEVFEARNGSDALNLVDRQKFDLILLDVMMPDIDGFEVAKKIVSNSQYVGTPIVFLSARTSIESKLEGLSLGAVDYITKPFDFRELLARIQLHLEKSEEKNRILEDNMNYKQVANTDFLTGLYNRRYIDEQLKNEFKLSKPTIASLLMLDLDHFKRINDTYGHDQGDLVLIKVAEIIKDSVRHADVVGRYGGEEFIVIMPSTTSLAAHSVAERIRVNIENHEFKIDENNDSITISIGISTFVSEEHNYKTFEEWVQAADKALYTAKKEGRNRVVVLIIAR